MPPNAAAMIEPGSPIPTTVKTAVKVAQRPAARWLTPVLLLALPVALFLSFFNIATLDIGNPGWLIRGTDNGENALGAHAYWHNPGAGVSLRTTLLNAPEGVPILYTDSNPLITLAAKPFAVIMPADAQLVGPFILLSLLLQTIFAWLLLRRHAPGPLALWTGVALLAFPPTLFNRYIHVNLMAHWTILAALWLFLDPRRGTKMRWWAPLIAITALIHSYLLLMVGAMWASSMLARVIQGSRKTRLVTVGQGVAILAMVALLAIWLGVGGQVTTGTFGRFSMGLDALWNPGIQTFSTIMPASENSPGRGFEGFQYLGFGGLILVAAAIIISRYRPTCAQEHVVAQRLRHLAPALIVLAILAILHMPLPDPVMTLLDPVRASGRLFWPVGYVLILMALLAVFRLAPDRAGLLLIAIVAVQIIDLAGMADAVRAQSASAADHRLYRRTLDPRWTPLIGDARSIAFMPGDVTRDLDLFQEVAWRAIKAGRPMTDVYAARTSGVTQQRLITAKAAFDRGDLVPGRLYILLPGTSVPASAETRAIRLDNVTIVAPDLVPR